MKRVLCAMSGGVDSSVAARLLLNQGYAVVGVTMVLIPDNALLENPSQDELYAYSPEAQDARAVARTLGINHVVVDYRSLFSEQVIVPFCKAYLSGLTPNPCIECNKYLKFGALQALRRKLECDYLATGHYAQVVFNEESQKYELHKGADHSKDQSYVLYHVSQEDLEHTLLPLGSYTKNETRELAGEAHFSNANKPESQDICFIPDGNYAAYIERFLLQNKKESSCKEEGHSSFSAGAEKSSNGEGCRQNSEYAIEPGPIVDTSGNQLGIHKGLLYYTIGQRKGLGVAVGEPLFVLKKDVEHNTLVVGRAEETGITYLVAADCAFPSDDDFSVKRSVQVKINYRARMRSATAWLEGEQLIIRFDEPIRGAAPGQAVVLYEGDRVVAGGTIAGFGHS